MNRRKFLFHSALGTLLLDGPRGNWLQAQNLAIERGAPSPNPIPEPQFPDRLHLFVWRNWELANTDRMAQVLRTTPDNILEIGASMGLPKKRELTEDQLRRIYITVIRQNWHVLPDQQLMELLGWKPEVYEYHLKEDDFLWDKLGRLKPSCQYLTYKPTSERTRRRAAEIKQLMIKVMGTQIDEPGEEPFTFINQLSNPRTTLVSRSQSPAAANEVDISHGWTLMEPPETSEIPSKLFEEFQAYLDSAFHCKLGIGYKRSGPSKTLQVSLNSSTGQTAGSFSIYVRPTHIKVVGRDVPGLWQAIYYLQDRMEERQAPYLKEGNVHKETRLSPRYVYSYFALYGDPLMDTTIDPFPDGFLKELSRAGVEGVWMQAVLRDLAPSNVFREFGKGAETRLRNLKRLVERAKNFGIKVYLYLNEPRSMSETFFIRYPEIKGTHDPGNTRFFAMCTSTQEVRRWIADSLTHVFERVPNLGGIFCITASENLTNCYSHGHAKFCPRCRKREADEVVAELIQTFHRGIQNSGSNAKVIAWDWGWGKNWVRGGPTPEGVIKRLPKDIGYLSVSEWDQPIDRGGYPTKVGEYSISVVGPGPRALHNWGLAKRQGLSIIAKVQWSNTWEISAVPYIPVPNLIVQHCENLLRTGIQGVMASWTVGGYPSPNFEAAREYYFLPPPTDGRTVLKRIADRRYGKEAAAQIVEAWKAFSAAFQEYPMQGGGLVYHIPSQHGPANPLRFRPTGYKAGMILFPYDDLKDWVGTYPVEVVETQFRKMASMWQAGLKSFHRALPLVSPNKKEVAVKDLGIAESCHLHFRSVANQIEFYRLRERLELQDGKAREEISRRMVQIAEDEIVLAKRQYSIARRDSTIAYEASNHYYYRPLDLVEKILSCHYVIDQIRQGMGKQKRGNKI